MNRPLEPPPRDFFRDPRPAAGERGLELELGGLRLQFAGLGDALADALLERYGPFVRPESTGPAELSVRVSVDERDYFITPPDRPELNPVMLSVDGDEVRYLGYRLAGWFDTSARRGRIVLAGGEYEPASHAVENYVRVAVAWLAAGRGGALVHAASAVLHDRGYLFYGESGAGKSTLAAVNTRARIVSDDLSLVLPGPAGPELVGSPFRGTYVGGDRVRGRFPLRAGFRIVQDVRAQVRRVARSVALAELVGNLPFVAEAFRKRPDLFDRIESTFATIPLAHLHFRKDDSYWDAVEQAGL